jgi:hypothetical protein
MVNPDLDETALVKLEEPAAIKPEQLASMVLLDLRSRLLALEILLTSTIWFFCSLRH